MRRAGVRHIMIHVRPRIGRRRTAGTTDRRSAGRQRNSRDEQENESSHEDTPGAVNRLRYERSAGREVAFLLVMSASGIDRAVPRRLLCNNIYDRVAKVSARHGLVQWADIVCRPGFHGSCLAFTGNVRSDRTVTETDAFAVVAQTKRVAGHSFLSERKNGNGICFPRIDAPKEEPNTRVDSSCQWLVFNRKSL